MDKNIGKVIPTFQVQYLGKPVILSCFSKTRVLWTKKGLQVAPDVVHLNNIIISKSSIQDSGVYTCHGSLSDNGHTRFSYDSEVRIASKTYFEIKYRFT